MPVGDLDPSFGASGVFTQNGSASGDGSDWGWDVTTAGANIFVTGYSQNGAGNNDFVVWKLTSTGTLDTSFGGGQGFVVFGDLAGGNGTDNGHAIAVDATGRILVAGRSDTSVTNDSAMVLLRLQANGNLDASFGSSGIVLHEGAAGGSGPNSFDLANALTLDADGRIVVVGQGVTVSGDYDLTVWRFLQTACWILTS